jgi:phosphatidylglycerophosphatase A
MIPLKEISKRVWQDPVYFLAFGFGLGLMPMAPGTWGTLAGIPVYLLIAQLPLWGYTLCTFVALVAGIWICDTVSRGLLVHDYGGIVWDEVVGYLLTLFMVPFSVTWMVVGFLLFRLFDIWKPMPIRYIDAHVHGGLGIMLDDVLAAIPAWAVLQCIVRIHF